MTEIGVLLPTREAAIYGPKDGDPRPLVAMAVRAEEMGFDSVWAGDSLLARPRAEPLVLLAGVATATQRIKLGTAVLLPSLRRAEQLAQQAATVDALSGGRLILGIGGAPGTPGVRTEHEIVGTDFDRRGSYSLAVAQRCRQLWRDETDEDLQPKSVSPGGPPIWMGGSGPRTLQRTGAHLDGWFPTATSPEVFATGMATVRAAAEEAGRDPAEIAGAAYLTVVIGETEQANAELAEHSQLYYGVAHDVISRAQGSLAGPVDAIVDWVGSIIAAGASHICVRIGCADVSGQMEQVAALLPQLR